MSEYTSKPRGSSHAGVPNGARHRAMQRSNNSKRGVFEEAETHRVIKPKTLKAAVPNKNKESVFSVYNNWKGLLSRHISLDLIAEKAVGSDIGHIKNLISFFGGTGRTFEALELFVTRWKDIQKKFSIAKNKDVPSLYLVDTLKQDILAVMCGKSSLQGEIGGSRRSDGQEHLIEASPDDVAKHFFNSSDKSSE
jgi:hypothetical protein